MSRKRARALAGPPAPAQPRATGSLFTAGVVLTIAALSVAVWTLFYVASPSAPLGANETVVVVLASAGIVLGVKYLGRWRRGSGAGADKRR